MKKFLPASTSLSTSKSSGFTLIELLVVIAIIAILAVMGFAAFRGLAGKGNDARRSADLKAVADALETNRGASYYVSLATNQFASGTIPVDPVASASGTANHGPYCISYATSGAVGNIPSTAQLYTGASNNCFSSGATGVGAGVSGGGTGAGWYALSSSVPTGNVTNWMVCGTLGDGGTAASNTVVCRNSAQ